MNMKKKHYIVPTTEINPILLEKGILAGTTENGVYANESDANQSFFDDEDEQSSNKGLSLWSD